MLNKERFRANLMRPREECLDVLLACNEEDLGMKQAESDEMAVSQGFPDLVSVAEVIVYIKMGSQRPNVRDTCEKALVTEDELEAVVHKWQWIAQAWRPIAFAIQPKNNVQSTCEYGESKNSSKTVP
jgi:hypothetical protein